jgi:hypothetical protein
MSWVSGFAPAKTYCPGQLITFRGWPHKIIPEELPNLGGIVFSANRFYQQPAEFRCPSCSSAITTRRVGFRGPGYAAPEMQPRPGTFGAW